MPSYHVERSIRISAPEAKVRAATADFSEWPKWSPWLCMEPTTDVQVHGAPGEPGHGYSWSGDLVGAGSMEITSVDNGVQRMDLAFLRPFKSQAKVAMHVAAAANDETDVTWQMDGKMPFFLFFMIKMMKVWIGMDYERGLKMLKEYVETGAVKSQTQIEGIVDAPGFHYVGVEARCNNDQMGPSMQKTMPAAHQAATDAGAELSGPPGTLYHDFNMKEKTCHYTSFVPIATQQDVAGAKSGSVGPCRALKIVHRGTYDHLGNAWTTAMAYQRNKKLKPDKSRCGYEFYPNDPADTPEEELITEIYVPVRA